MPLTFESRIESRFDGSIPDEAWASAAATLHSGASDDPWRGGWRLNAPTSLRLAAGDEQRTVPLSSSDDRSTVVVRVADTAFVDVAGLSVAFRIAPPPDVDRAARAAASHTGGPVQLIAPMPGSVLAIHAASGEAVAGGDPVVTLEAMKMEHAVAAPIDGRVADLPVSAGDQVARGQVLGVVEP